MNHPQVGMIKMAPHSYREDSLLGLPHYGKTNLAQEKGDQLTKIAEVSKHLVKRGLNPNIP